MMDPYDQIKIIILFVFYVFIVSKKNLIDFIWQYI